MKSFVLRLVRRFGYEVIKSTVHTNTSLLSDDELAVWETVQPYTMTSVERVVSLVQAVNYIAENKIKGDFVECGVWRGGSMMAVALSLVKLGLTDRKLFLYDTYEGMSAPTDSDVDLNGELAEKHYKETVATDEKWCYADETDVWRNLLSTGYPEENIILVKGKVEDTIPTTLPESISLLRLDTDWYESTKHELEHLYPLLSVNGVLIVDDYGHWRGSKKAVDEFFVQKTFKPLLNRIDYTGRLIIKN